MSKLNIEKIENENTLVGGVPNGEHKVILTGFDVKPDSKGANNYQFELTFTEYEGITRTFRTSLYSMYKQTISNIGVQLGFKGTQLKDSEVLTKASETPFSVWINGRYTNFYEYQAPETESVSDLENVMA